MCNILQQILAIPKSLSYLKKERKSENPSPRGANMQKRNVLRLCRLRVLCGKKYRFSSVTPIKSSHRCLTQQRKKLFMVLTSAKIEDILSEPTHSRAGRQ